MGRLQRAATIVPLALLSAAWTASVAGIGGVTPPVSASQGPDGSLPDGTSVPTEAIEAPASVSDPGDLSPTGNTQNIVATASTNQIPSAALAAYQRAEAVINKADKSCHLTWQLVAAIGRVESNHGRFKGNVLDDDGVAKPGIYGVALNGRSSTKAISDTDGGQFDNDTQWDRAVGPMQFIPSTWSIVGVDADGDAKRNPQDIDDAALATAVYLCSGKDDLSTVVGQRAAVYRYNHSQAYVDLVLSIMDAYLEGDFTTIPNNTTVAGYIVPEAPSYNPGTYNGLNDDSSGDPGFDNEGDYVPPAGGDDEEPTDPTDPTDPVDPTDPTNPGNNGGTDNIPDTNTPIDEPLENLWTVAEATAACVAQLLDGVANPLGLNTTALLQSLGLIDDKTECVNDLVGTPQN
ncbi:lytic transglycosylase domain-containing protein [Nocardioides bizhenqiangii]|uniref:Lytic murein transglycosylase n=1 Tax=Nocardioides bizhenqiangii TaxID=3095076 RepID=A0ABZ0ZT43_9ACTN|nr:MULTISPECIES: lytic murein transglycosylase [unclassified Nocardioides]MDZ5622704.1 lytic murein transglycosylase [Nocardioides sp. HM23]WQQ26971.1 lytic murein transglycosylase [Nocardioides sp. HM61]